MVKRNNLLSAQQYLELVTGQCHVIDGDDDINTIYGVLAEYNLDLWNYPLDEIDHIVDNKLDVVLVDCMVWNNTKNEYEHNYRWFEVE